MFGRVKYIPYLCIVELNNTYHYENNRGNNAGDMDGNSSIGSEG